VFCVNKRKKSVPSVGSFHFLPVIHDEWDKFEVLRSSSRADLYTLESELANEARHNAERDRAFLEAPGCSQCTRERRIRYCRLTFRKTDGNALGSVPSRPDHP
jgi:hypothetical protein